MAPRVTVPEGAHRQAVHSSLLIPQVDTKKELADN